jgi:tetratricopeptide (TPR) repeat protein
MKTALTAAPAVPSRPTTPATELAFPARATLPTLRKLREKHFRDGRHDLALQVAMEVARRDPGRESFFRLGFHFREVGRYREGLKSLRDALRFESGPKYVVAEIHLHVAYTWFLLRGRKRMGESLRRAYALRPKPRTACNFHLAYGTYLMSKKKFREAAEEYGRAGGAATKSLARGRATCNQGYALMRQGMLAEARRSLDRAIRILKRSGHPADLAIARMVRAAVCFDEGQPRRALGMFLRVARTYRSAGKVDREAEALVNAGYMAGELGQWPRSRALVDRAIGLASTTGQYSVLAPAYALRATACAYFEDFDESVKNLAQSQRLLKGQRDWVAALHVCRAQGRVSALLGRWGDVFRAARRGERLAIKVGDLPRVAEFRNLKAAAEEKLGHRRAALHARKAALKVDALLEGPSRRTKEITRITPKLAGSGLPLLLVGRSGAGLLPLAEEIHSKSRRSAGPCVVVACEQLVFPASDLQGHVEGAWSGAAHASIGQVAQASGGTLVLDRVDLLSRDGQQVLLRIVDGKLRPVGSAEERPVDLRIIATCASVEGLLPDLLHRLEGAVIRVPELGERKEEIVRAVRQQLAGRRRITPDGLAELARHSWEGDLPQLRATVDRLVALSDTLIGQKLVRAVVMPTKTGRVARRVDPVRSSRLELATTP